MRSNRFLSGLLCLICCTLTLSAVQAQKKREMRGAWVATVANIDWPTDRTALAEQQKEELIRTIDSLHRTGVNAIMFQVRPTADALYKSDLEPWSEWLTGEQGKAPSSDFDPLQTAVEECHKRCMELHAWINPYRVTNTPNAKLAPNHIYFKKPELFIQYGEKIYFDPGRSETADFLLKVLKDMVTRYDVDGLHLDDYFYPYPISGKEFPDEATFKANPRGFKNKGDWRRDNVTKWWSVSTRCCWRPNLGFSSVSVRSAFGETSRKIPRDPIRRRAAPTTTTSTLMSSFGRTRGGLITSHRNSIGRLAKRWRTMRCLPLGGVSM